MSKKSLGFALLALITAIPAMADGFKDAGSLTSLAFVQAHGKEWIKIGHTSSPDISGVCGTWLYSDVTFLEYLPNDPGRNAINISLLQKALGNPDFRLFARSSTCKSESGGFDGKYMNILKEWQVRKVN